MKEDLNLTKSQIREWWSDKRYLYNLGLVLSGIIAFILYVIVGVNFIMPYDDEFEITLFTIVFQGIGYLIMIVFANLFYSLGVTQDLNHNKENTDDFRKKLFNLGFWFSVSLPLLAPLWLLISYFFRILLNTSTMKKIRIKFLLFVYDKTQKLYRKYFKKKKRQWQFNEKQLLEFHKDSLGRKLGEFYKKHGFTMIPKMENHDVHHLLTGCGTNFEDEIAMQFLLLGNGKLNAHLLAAIGLGTVILPEYYKIYIKAYKKGRSMRTFHHVDFESLLWQNFENLQDFFRQKQTPVFY